MKGRIYMIKSKQTDKVYVGSTELTLNKRFSKHKTQHCTSQEILKHADATIELLECYECQDEKQLKKREGEYIKQYNCVNERIAGRTQKEYYQENKEAISQKHKQRYEKNKEAIAEYKKEYREKNKEKIAEYSKEYDKKYYQNNKEQINEKKKEKFECPCGGKYTHCHKARHFRTKMHQDYFKD